MEDLHNQIALQLKELTETLMQPFPASATADGWCEASWLKWQRIFSEMRESFSSGLALPNVSISRAMDFDGIIGGVVLDKAAALSNVLRHLHKNSVPNKSFKRTRVLRAT